ncbi:TBB [Symbiodinium natans]|uniref:TBB protein n=1 Tax=Symbiodinium natans TaxID=878477 RepID=A0A812JNP7_9DINO|nr:TBB [Symbiodinium natans]
MWHLDRRRSCSTGCIEVLVGVLQFAHDDLELERQGENQVFVKKILGPGPALQKNVVVGDVVSKVNRQKMDWRSELSEEDYEHIERSLMPDKDGSLTIVFQDAPKKSLMQRLVKVCCRCVGVKKKVKPGSGQSATEFAMAKNPVMRPTVRNFWRSHGAIAEVEKESLGEWTQEDKEEEESVASEAEDAEGLEDRQLLDEVPQERSRLAKARAKKRLDGFLFSRWPDGKAPKEASAANSAPQTLEGHDDSLQLQEEDILQEGWDVDEMADVIKSMRITGQEVWLDCLLVALEEEVLEESPIVEVLRTNDLQDVSKDKLKGPARERLLKFYRRLDQVLKILENKSYRKYYQNLLAESVQRQQLFQQQNEVLHDYVCELEKEFADISDAIYNYRSKKELMLTKLAGLLDRGEYSHLGPRRGRKTSKR